MLASVWLALASRVNSRKDTLSTCVLGLMLSRRDTLTSVVAAGIGATAAAKFGFAEAGAGPRPTPGSRRATISTQARKLIDECGYGRRREELADAEAAWERLYGVGRASRGDVRATVPVLHGPVIATLQAARPQLRQFWAAGAIVMAGLVQACRTTRFRYRGVQGGRRVRHGIDFQNVAAALAFVGILQVRGVDGRDKPGHDGRDTYFMLYKISHRLSPYNLLQALQPRRPDAA